jgi:hypothetical protein
LEVVVRMKEIVEPIKIGVNTQIQNRNSDLGVPAEVALR